MPSCHMPNFDTNFGCGARAAALLDLFKKHLGWSAKTFAIATHEEILVYFMFRRNYCLFNKPKRRCRPYRLAVPTDQRDDTQQGHNRSPLPTAPPSPSALLTDDTRQGNRPPTLPTAPPSCSALLVNFPTEHDIAVFFGNTGRVKAYKLSSRSFQNRHRCCGRTDVSFVDRSRESRHRR